jgi:hypothetical protein
MLGSDEIANRVGPHKARTDFEIGEQNAAHNFTSRIFLQVMNELDQIVPDGRCKEIAFAQMETALMWANKGIAEQFPLVAYVDDQP